MSEPLYLAPRLESRPAALLDSPGFLHPLVTALGSPLNVLLPDQLADNVRRFQDVYARHRLAGRIHYAHKANRSSALVRRLAADDGPTGIDVASLGELQHALSGGFTPDRIVATGPKDPDFLWLAARTGVTVCVDSPAELTALAALVERFRLPRVRVMPRLSQFTAPGTRILTRRSRFGTPVSEAAALLDLVEKHADGIELTGLSYHLDTMGIAEKAVALEGCLTVLDECRRRGLRPLAVDIGGGFGVDYLADGAQWERYTTELTRALLGKRPPLTWQGHGYGLRADSGTVRGALAVYPGHRPVAGARYLDELLAQTAPSLGRPLATLLLENLYDLHVEPGRALLDQCGITLVQVREVRHTADGDRLVRLAANARDVGLEDHGLLIDPVLVPARPEPPGSGGTPVGVYLLGNLCLEADLISRRTVFLPREPRPGDLLAFANTAGYFMDFTADHALHQPVARKVAVHGDGDGGWSWCLDDQYWPHLTAGDAL
ncbi:Y4yA family PLP-dependent enzyme [Streptomyces coeruleoprunus]|uniref:Y4yA family PLP-dependent enzyme n=1 Tax=Streptomyces coeruleoprunus TaxID=285563 RepID=A0ABV9XHA6_9ACTN